MRSFQILSMALCVNCWAAHAQAQKSPDLKDSCSEVTVFGSQPLSAFPPLIQRHVRQAVEPAMLSIVKDPGMGMSQTKLKDVQLNAIQISKPSRNDGLYIVSWDDRSFGVNGAIWLVEVTSTGAQNLTSSDASQPSGFSLGGFGMEVLSPDSEKYPEVMIASSGFKVEGGAEAEASCLRKTGRFYEAVSCPAHCYNTLNSR